MTKQRLIDANALLNKLDETIRGFETILSRLKTREPSVYLNEGLIFAAIELVKFMKEFLEKAPTVERPRGEWIKTFRCKGEDINTGTILSLYYYDCPKCKYRTGNQGKEFYFCPNCGADMRGEGE